MNVSYAGGSVTVLTYVVSGCCNTLRLGAVVGTSRVTWSQPSERTRGNTKLDSTSSRFLPRFMTPSRFRVLAHGARDGWVAGHGQNARDWTAVTGGFRGVDLKLNPRVAGGNLAA